MALRGDAVTAQTASFSHNLGKPSKFEVWQCQLWLILQTQLRAKGKRQGIITLAVTTASVLVLSLLLGFLWFRLPWSPTESQARYKVITTHSLMFNVLSILRDFLVFSNDRKTRLATALKSIGNPPHLHRPSSMPRKVQNKGYEWQFPPSVIWYGRLGGDLPFKVTQVILSSIIVFPLVRVTEGFGRFLLYTLALILQSITNNSLAYCTSALFANKLSSYYALVLVFTFNYLFSGANYSVRQVSWIILWIRYVCPSYYVNQMLIWTTFRDVTYEGYEVTGNEILRVQGWSTIDYGLALVGLLSITLIFNCIGPVFLWFSTVRRS